MPDQPRPVNSLPHRPWSRWYLPSLAIVPASLLLAYAILRPTGTVAPLAQAPILLVLFLFSAACEEIGWQGYATARLYPRWGI